MAFTSYNGTTIHTGFQGPINHKNTSAIEFGGSPWILSRNCSQNNS